MEKQIMAILSEEELQEINDLMDEEKAISATLKDVINKRGETYQKVRKWWKLIGEKYNLGPNTIIVNHTTGELILQKPDVSQLDPSEE